jgi:hypothetical protein
MKKMNSVRPPAKIRHLFFLCLISGAPVFAAGVTDIIYEGESAEEMIDATVSSNGEGFVGSGYAIFDNSIGASLKWTRVFSGGGNATLNFRYANGSRSMNLRPTALYVNDIKISVIEWPQSDSEAFWKTQEVQVTLQRGINTVELRLLTSAGPNLDQMTVTSPPAELKTVPDVKGLHREAAQTAIISAGMVIGKITTECSTTVRAGTVIRQKPDSGSSQPSGGPIDLVISLGPPATVGQSEQAFLPAI